VLGASGYDCVSIIYLLSLMVSQFAPVAHTAGALSVAITIHFPVSDHETLPIVRKVGVEGVGPAVGLHRIIALVQSMALVNGPPIDRPESYRLRFRKSLPGEFGQWHHRIGAFRCWRREGGLNTPKSEMARSY